MSDRDERRRALCYRRALWNRRALYRRRGDNNRRALSTAGNGNNRSRRRDGDGGRQDARETLTSRPIRGCIGASARVGGDSTGDDRSCLSGRVNVATGNWVRSDGHSPLPNISFCHENAESCLQRVLAPRTYPGVTVTVVDTKASHSDCRAAKGGLCRAVPATARPQLLLQIAADTSEGAPMRATTTEKVFMMAQKSGRMSRCKEL